MRYFKTRITDGGASGNRGASSFPGRAHLLTTSSSQAAYPSPRRKRQGSLIPLLLLSPQSLRLCGDPLWRWYAYGIVRSPRGMRLLRKPMYNAAFLRNCHHCPRSRLFCSICKIVVWLTLSQTIPPTACENSAQNNPSDMFGSFVAAITLT